MAMAANNPGLLKCALEECEREGVEHNLDLTNAKNHLQVLERVVETFKDPLVRRAEQKAQSAFDEASEEAAEAAAEGEAEEAAEEASASPSSIQSALPSMSPSPHAPPPQSWPRV